MSPLPGPLSIAAGMAFALAVSGLAIVVLLRARAKLPQDAPNERSLHAAPLPAAGGIAIWAGFLPGRHVDGAACAGRHRAVAGPVAPAGAGLAAGRCACARRRRAPAGARAGGALVRHWLGVARFDLARCPTCMAGGDGGCPAGRRHRRMVAQPLQFHGRQRRTGGGDGHSRISPPTVSGAVIAGAPATAFFALAAATVPFFVVNRPPSRLIMGDVGRRAAGFSRRGIRLALVAAGTWPAWFPALVFLPFIADATLTLGRRAWRPRTPLGGAPVPLLSAAAPVRRRTSRNTRDLQRLDGGLRSHRAGLSALRTRAGLAGSSSHGVSAGAALFAAIDYHWGSRPGSIR